MAQKFEIRNSIAEFLTFIAEGKENGVQVAYRDETIWAMQKAIAQLFDVGVPAIDKPLNNIYSEGELSQSSTISKMEIVQMGGSLEVTRQVDFYNPDAISDFDILNNCYLLPLNIE